MPIYEYQCQECQHALDALQRVGDSLLTDCPECGKPALRKLISAPGFRLKGSGWYETDFKTGNKKNLAGEKAPATDAGSKGGKDGKDGKGTKDAKEDKKPAAKPAAQSGSKDTANGKKGGKSGSASGSKGS